MTPQLTKNAVAVRADIDVRSGRAVELLRKAFSPKGRRARSDIFERVGRRGSQVPRLPIKKAAGPSPAQMFGPIGDNLLREHTKVTTRIARAEVLLDVLRQDLTGR